MALNLGRPQARRRRTPWGRIALAAYAGVVLLGMFVPVFLVILFSFNASRTGGWPITGWTLKWYQALFSDYLVLGALKNSLWIGGIATVLATIIGTATAFPLVRAPLRFRDGIRVFFTMPIMLPGLLIGVALLVFFSALKIKLSLFTVTIGHLVMVTPFVILVVAARLQGFDRRLERAAADLGATPVKTLRYVVLPLMLPGIITGALFAFTMSLDEFIVTYFNIGSTQTIPIYIYTQIKFGITPEVNALAAVLLVGTTVLIALTLGLMRQLQARNNAR